MSRSTIDTSGTGDPLPSAFAKVNTMTAELYYSTLVDHTGTPVTLTAGDLGKVHTNRGGSALQIWNLPAGADGYRFCARRIPAYEIRLTPASGQAIADGGANKYLSIQSRGSVYLEWQVDRWEVVGGDAVWNLEP